MTQRLTDDMPDKPGAMRLEAASVLLGDTRRAVALRRLAAVWPDVDRETPDTDTVDLYDRWGELAGVTGTLARIYAQQLFRLKICYEDGRVDGVAKRFIRAEARRGNKR